MTGFFSSKEWAGESGFDGVEVQVCSKTRTVLLHAGDYGNGEPPEWLNMHSATVTLAEAREQSK